MSAGSPFVVAAYAVFAIAFAWDFLAPRLRLRRAHRDIAARARRDTSPKGGARKATA